MIGILGSLQDCPRRQPGRIELPVGQSGRGSGQDGVGELRRGHTATW